LLKGREHDQLFELRFNGKELIEAGFKKHSTIYGNSERVIEQLAFEDGISEHLIRQALNG
jgi:hypothetical protein